MLKSRAIFSILLVLVMLAGCGSDEPKNIISGWESIHSGLLVKYPGARVELYQEAEILKVDIINSGVEIGDTVPKTREEATEIKARMDGYIKNKFHELLIWVVDEVNQSEALLESIEKQGINKVELAFKQEKKKWLIFTTADFATYTANFGVIHEET